MTTLVDDIANFLRSVADWLEGGDNVKLIFGIICTVLTLWVLSDFWQLWRNRKQKSKPDQQTPDVASELRMAMSQRALAKQQSNLAKAKLDTSLYNINAAFLRLLTEKPKSNSSGGSDND